MVNWHHNMNNIILAVSEPVANTSVLSGWQFVAVFAVMVICFVKLITVDWPWSK